VPTHGLLLVAGLFAPAAPAVGPPRLDRGLELVYAGEVVEASDRVESRFRKRADLEVRVLVVEAGPRTADCAVLTRVRPLEDPAVAGAAVADPGRAPMPAAVTLEFVRVDSRGRCQLLRPAPGPSPLLFTDAATVPAPPIPLDGPPAIELGMFVPLPPTAVAVGDGWDVPDTGRPPLLWRVAGETVRNGGRCVEVTAGQQSDGWDRPAVAPTGWRRTDSVLVSPLDGFAAAVRRRSERRDGAGVSTWTEVRYELRPPARLTGTRYTDARAEAEAGYCFAAAPGPATLAKIDRYLASRPAPTAYRDAVDAARRRCLAAARGDAVVPAAAVVPVVVPDLGQPAPDFVADGFRLSAVRGKPVVVVFFKPGSETAAGTLAVADALHKTFAGRAAVVAVGGGTLTGVSVPVVDGAGVRERYGVDSYPRFVVIDAGGLLAWRFDGFGAETGYLVKQQIERMLGGGSENRR
jgi:hypothetical protein